MKTLSARAGKATKSAKAAKVSRPDAQKPVKIRLEALPDAPTYYANFVEISHTAHEFMLSTARVPTKLPEPLKQEAVNKGELVLTPELQIVIAPTVLPGLIRALKIQRESYEKKFGEIREDSKNERD